MLEHIYAVVGSGSSDIGKGWLTAAIASILPNALPVKVDPFLNTEFPADIGTRLGDTVVSEDFETYARLGLPVFPASNILNGALLSALLRNPPKRLERGSIKKLTFADVSELLADMILTATRQIDDCRNLVIEVGGIVTDRENIWIPSALKMLGARTGLTPEIVLLSYIEQAEVGFAIKTQNVRFAVREARSRYALPIKACFVRRRLLPAAISEAEIVRELRNVAFETQLAPSSIVFEDNFADVFALKQFVQATGIFAQLPQSVLVSACLLGVPCRHDGSAKALNPRVLEQLRRSEVVAICPELLAGLDTPRTPCEIVGGDGEDVLSGKARVMSKDGQDRTQHFVTGAQRALEAIRRVRPSRIILCDRSPSCGGSQIYDGTFSYQLKPGRGLLPVLLDRDRFPYLTHTQLAAHDA